DPPHIVAMRWVSLGSNHLTIHPEGTEGLNRMSNADHPEAVVVGRDRAARKRGGADYTGHIKTHASQSKNDRNEVSAPVRAVLPFIALRFIVDRTASYFRILPVCTENLNPNVMVMKSAQALVIRL